MSDAAAEADVLHSLQPQEASRIDIGNIRADNQRGHGKAGFLLETGLSEYRSDKAVGEIIHRPEA